MLKTRVGISDDCATKFGLGYYHMMTIREALGEDAFQLVVQAGVEKLLVEWSQNSNDQRECYLMLAREGTNPVTAPAEELWHEI